MAEPATAEQVYAKHIRVLGNELGPLYHALYNEVSELHVRWGQYCELYAHSSERVDLLNQAGAQFFCLVQNIFWADILLSIARITDRPKAGRSARLSLRSLPGSIQDSLLREEVERLAADADTPFVRKYRNLRLAHRNRDVSLGCAEALPGISRQHVDEVLTSIRAVLNRIEDHYFGYRVAYEHTIEGLGGAATVVYHLKIAIDSKRARLDQLKQFGTTHE